MKMEMVTKIKRMKVGQSFMVKGQYARKEVLGAAKVLKRLGHIDFDVVTKAADGDNFKVAAI